MMLYALLVIPREILTRTSYQTLKTHIKRINPLVYSLIEKEETISNYNGEIETKNINYFKHIRNAIAHSKCHYYTNENKNYVNFFDNTQDNSKQCHIKIECYKVEYILVELQRLIMEYYNDNHQR